MIPDATGYPSHRDCERSLASHSTMSSEAAPTRRQHVLQLLRNAAKQAVQQGDPWASRNMQDLPAERVIRHLYDPVTSTWSTDETIVKMEKDPFTHGAMRHCYRLKKRAQPPKHATNHHFHKTSWKLANNYIAKAYQIDAVMDTSDEAKKAVQNDIILQYEAEHWALLFNQADPPTKIHFIRAYALEFPNRPGQPWLAVERYIAGTDRYGYGFHKHNTNSGFVDDTLHRVTPQVLSAFSFYASQGQRLVADIQGVGDLYTDPQVLSHDYRFGEGDLGPRGMALFFCSFRHSTLSDALGIPNFPLSRNEMKHQIKYDEDEETVSDEEASVLSGQEEDDFQRLDNNRLRRKHMLQTPMDILPDDSQATLRRSNLMTSQDDLSSSLRQSLRSFPPPGHLKRHKSDIDEVTACLQRSLQDRIYDHRDFHRTTTGELRERQFKSQHSFHRSQQVKKVSPPMMPTEETRKNLGKVHYQLAVLHGMGRFPEIVPEESSTESPNHDVFSVLFHLSYACALKNAAACLALGRVQANLDSSVSPLLKLVVPTHFENAKEVLQRGLESPCSPATPKAAAGCLLYQILQDERHVEEIKDKSSDALVEHVLLTTIQVLREADEEKKQQSDFKQQSTTRPATFCFHVGDRVDANYAMEGTYYAGTVLQAQEDQVTIQYDDDGSSETLSKDHVRLLVPPTAFESSLGGPLSDEEAFGSNDDGFVLELYHLQAELAKVKQRQGQDASALWEEAAELALAAGKAKLAAEYSLQAAS